MKPLLISLTLLVSTITFAKTQYYCFSAKSKSVEVQVEFDSENRMIATLKNDDIIITYDNSKDDTINFVPSKTDDMAFVTNSGFQKIDYQAFICDVVFEKH